MQDSIDFDYQVDVKSVKLAFNLAAKNYDAFSLLQKTVADRLLESFDHIKAKPSLILDLGSGTGYGSKQLKLLFKGAHILQSDLSCQMLNIARKQSSRWFSKNHYVCANANEIPFPDNSVDLVFSSLMLQWCNKPDVVFAEVNRVLKPDGVFLFSSFGPDTLKELRQSWRKVDDDVHVNAFTDMHDIGDALIRSGMDAPVLSNENIILTYDDCKQLMRELKNIGAHNVNQGRRKTLTGKQRLQQVINHYESYRQNDKLPATYEVVYGHAWKSVNKNKGSNVQSVLLEDLKQDLKNRKLKQ
jgi:malonyl-CoA O-methyltransferase